nr:Uncharacterised protein [Raoultella sp. NCTC 9187]
MRILVKALFRMAQADFLQQGQHLTLALGGAVLLMQTQDLPDLGADSLHRVQRVARVLRHQADARAAQAIEPLTRPAADILRVNDDLPAVAAGVICQQADNRLGGGGLAGAGLADERQHFAAPDAKADAVHHLAPLLPGAVADTQVFNA